MMDGADLPQPRHPERCETQVDTQTYKTERHTGRTRYDNRDMATQRATLFVVLNTPDNGQATPATRADTPAVEDPSGARAPAGARIPAGCATVELHANLQVKTAFCSKSVCSRAFAFL